MNNHDLHRVLFGNHAIERNASTLIQDLGRDDIEGHLLEQLLKPIHAMTYECYTCYNISIYSETSCVNADWCSPFGVGAPKHRSSFLKALFSNSEDNSLQSQKVQP